MSTRAAPVAGSHFHSSVCFALLRPGDAVGHPPVPPGPGQALPALSALMRGALDVAPVAATTRVSHATVLRALGSIAWPCGSASAAPAARAASGTRPRLQLGMAISRSRGPCLSKHTESRPRLTKLLATYVHQHLPELAFASLALAHSSEAGAHEDPNTGDTAVIALGPFPRFPDFSGFQRFPRFPGFPRSPRARRAGGRATRNRNRFPTVIANRTLSLPPPNLLITRRVVL